MSRPDKNAPKNGWDAYFSGYARSHWSISDPKDATWRMQWAAAHACSYASHCESREFNDREKAIEALMTDNRD